MTIVVQCPHCNCEVIIEKLNCKIFRHGIFKKNGKQMNPHCPKSQCDKYVEKDLIYGCGKPFQVVKHDVYKAVACDYI
jgi:G:T-mismatch repair DNA endonuclease (very short patch repair protein)